MVVRGSISVYPPRGQYQLVATRIQPVGAGDLAAGGLGCRDGGGTHMVRGRLGDGLAAGPDGLYAGVEPAGLFRSDDGGQNWTWYATTLYLDDAAMGTP